MLRCSLPSQELQHSHQVKIKVPSNSSKSSSGSHFETALRLGILFAISRCAFFIVSVFPPTVPAPAPKFAPTPTPSFAPTPVPTLAPSPVPASSSSPGPAPLSVLPAGSSPPSLPSAGPANGPAATTAAKSVRSSYQFCTTAFLLDEWRSSSGSSTLTWLM